MTASGAAKQRGLEPGCRQALAALSAFGAAACAFGCFSPVSTNTPVAGPSSPTCSNCTHHGASGGANGGTAGNASAGTGASGGAAASSGAAASGGANASSGGGADSGGGSSGGSTSPGSGSSGGGSTGATAPMCSAIAGDQGSGIFDCNAPNLIETGPPGCTNPYFVSTLQDLETCGAVCDATVQLLDPSGIPIFGASGISDPSSGQIAICLPGDATFTPSTAATGYPQFYYGEIQHQLTQPLEGLGMINSATVGAFGGLFSGYKSTEATIVIYTYTYGDCVAANAGWSLALELPDGGPWPDGGYRVVYVDAATGAPNPSLTATSSYGVGVVVGVDPSISDVATLVFTNPDAGACPLLNAELGFTGHIRLGNGAFSVQGIFLP